MVALIVLASWLWPELMYAGPYFAPIPPAPTTTVTVDPGVTLTVRSCIPPAPPPPRLFTPPPPPPATTSTRAEETQSGTVHSHVPTVENVSTMSPPVEVARGEQGVA